MSILCWVTDLVWCDTSRQDFVLIVTLQEEEEEKEMFCRMVDSFPQGCSQRGILFSYTVLYSSVYVWNMFNCVLYVNSSTVVVVIKSSVTKSCGPCLPDGSDSRTRVCFDGPASAQQGGADGSSRSEKQISRCLTLKTHVQQFFMNVHKSDTEVCVLKRDIRSGKLQGTV